MLHEDRAAALNKILCNQAINRAHYEGRAAKSRVEEETLRPGIWGSERKGKFEHQPSHDAPRMS